MKDMAEPGRLLLCATPIGNLEDMTPRVVAAMREADVIAAEDTRNTIKLLNHFDIHTPMVSYHEYNKFERADELVGRMLRGETVAVVTDAGTPAISDPGEVLAAKCIEAGIRVSSLPGACALITALTMSGMSARRFAFEGFLPNDKAEKKERTRIACARRCATWKNTSETERLHSAGNSPKDMRRQSRRHSAAHSNSTRKKSREESTSSSWKGKAAKSGKKSPGVNGSR